MKKKRPFSRLTVDPQDKTKPHHKGAVLIKAIPMTTKAAFKAACALRDTAMRDVFIILMRKFAVAVRDRRPSIQIDDIQGSDAEDKRRKEVEL